MSTLEHTGHWQDRLEDIRHWYGQLPDQLASITGYAMNLTGPDHATEPPIPGGDVLVLTGPWAPDATCGDTTPHPDQTITEWSHTIHDAHGLVPNPRATWTQHWRYLHDQTPWILDSPWADAYTTDIEQLWWHLARLTGNQLDDPTPPPPATDTDVWNALEQHPDHELTRRDLTHLGVNASTLTTWRHRGHLTETRPGHYRAGDILELRATA